MNPRNTEENWPASQFYLSVNPARLTCADKRSPGQFMRENGNEKPLASIFSNCRESYMNLLNDLAGKV